MTTLTLIGVFTVGLILGAAGVITLLVLISLSEDARTTEAETHYGSDMHRGPAVIHPAKAPPFHGVRVPDALPPKEEF